MFGNLQGKGILTFTLTEQSCIHIKTWDNDDGMVEFELADSEDPTKMPALGITEEITGAIGGTVTIVTVGPWIGKADFSPNTVLYVNGATLSDTPGTKVQAMGQVMRQGTETGDTDGQVFIYGCGQVE